jgi:hypothetical protein
MCVCLRVCVRVCIHILKPHFCPFLERITEITALEFVIRMLAPRCQDGSITWTSCYNNSGDLSHFIFPFSRNWRFFSVVKTTRDLF